MADGGDDDATLTGDDRIVHRARKRFARCKAWYDTAYRYSLEDEKFAAQDARNNYGWPDKIFADRDGKRKPCLTINIVEPHNRLVINEAMENRASPRVRATGGAATADAAQAMQTLLMRTENISSAIIAYRNVITHQVNGGFGYLYLETAYTDDKSFNQDVYIKSVEDPRTVYLDLMDQKEPDGSDAQFGFIFERMSRDRFNQEHPKFKNKIGTSTLGADMLWLTDKHVLLATYFERAAKNDELITYTLPDGSEFLGRRSEMEESAGPELVEKVIRQIDDGEIEGKYRDVLTQEVNRYLIGGDKIIKRGDTKETRWIGEYIPIIPCYGIKSVIDGVMDCKGHTRAQISPQQMLNYNASGQVQFGALQSKTPYIGPAKAFEFNEKEWGEANIEDRAYLAYEDWAQEEGEEGRQVAAPTRQEPPQISPVFANGMQDAERWSMMVSGQWQDLQGQQNQQGPESGKAIGARQRQGNLATYHFTEHQYDMYRLLGKQLIGIYPKLYDTKRILHVEGEDLSKKIVNIDPEAKEAFQRVKKETETAEEIIFNPNVGEYQIVSDPGPNYATQRQQAWEAMTQIIAQNKELAAIFGDLAIKNGDFAGADEIAERMKKWIQHTSPWLFEDGQDPTLAALQAQIAEGQKLNAELMMKLADYELRLRGRDERRDIEAVNAETKRLDVIVRALEKLGLPAGEVARMQHELGLRTHDAALDMIVQSNAADIAAQNQPATNGSGE